MRNTIKGILLCGLVIGLTACNTEELGPNTQQKLGQNGGGTTNTTPQPTQVNLGLGAPSNATVSHRYEVNAAEADEYAQSGGGHALRIGALGDFVFVKSGELVRQIDGTAHLAGEIVSVDNPNRKFQVDLRYSAMTTTGTPKKELKSEAYDPAGPVKTDAWIYYQMDKSALEGEGELKGMRIELAQKGPNLQIGEGANGKNVRFGASNWFTFKVMRAPEHAVSGLPAGGDGDVNIDLSVLYCIERAIGDQYNQYPAGHALYIPGIGTDFVFNEPGRFVEKPDGTARFTGWAHRLSAPDQEFEVDIYMRGRTNVAPEGNPYHELKAEAYNEAVDDSSWHYYTQVGGVLTGKKALQGLVMSVTRRGPAFQVGEGANGKNIELGGSGWLTYQILTQTDSMNYAVTGQGDFNVNFKTCTYYCATAAEGDPKYTNVANAGHALDLNELGHDWVFVDKGLMIEYADGTARLTGRIYRKSNSNQIFDLDVKFWDRTVLAVEGSPKKELYSPAYAIVSDDFWHYYKTWEGKLIGHGELEGANVDIYRKGPPMQFGPGANGKNLNFGASAWLEYAVVTQPTAATGNPNKRIHPCGDGDINIDLPRCEHDCPPEERNP